MSSTNAICALSSRSIFFSAATRPSVLKPVAVIHKRNTFAFMGDHNWDPIVSFLEIIGPVNRIAITNIKIEVKAPEQVWQLADGRRKQHPNNF